MQTFLPYSDFYKSLNCLDYKRLGKQRVEADQILKSLTIKDYGWKNHPIVKMWKGYEKALILYRNTAIDLWIKRGYKNTMKILDINEKVNIPHWLGNEKLHSSHRSNLLRKDYNFYSKYNWTEKDNLPYLWII